MSGGETIVWLVQIWLTAGAVVAALFLFVGIDRIDDDARGRTCSARFWCLRFC